MELNTGLQSDLQSETLQRSCAEGRVESDRRSETCAGSDLQSDEIKMTFEGKKKRKQKLPENQIPIVGPKSDSYGVDDNSDYTYAQMLKRVYEMIGENKTKVRKTIPVPVLVKVGTRKTMCCNFSNITSALNRTTDHLMSFIVTEFGTQGSIDASSRLLLKGLYKQVQFESIIKKYVQEYVTCLMCKDMDSIITKDSTTRLNFLSCQKCGAVRSVAIVKTGFHAVNKADRKLSRNS
jgi:translation initiation factor 2 subunit 2